MNLATMYFAKRSIPILLGRYYSGYRNLVDFRAELLREYKFESIRLREIPGKHALHTWELRVSGKNYFFNYDPKSKIFSYVGVR